MIPLQIVVVSVKKYDHSRMYVESFPIGHLLAQYLKNGGHSMRHIGMMLEPGFKSKERNILQIAYREGDLAHILKRNGHRKKLDIMKLNNFC